MSVPADILPQLLRYDPETGKLFWLEREEHWFAASPKRSALWNCRRWNSAYASKPALNHIGLHGARSGHLLGETVYAHRVAWALHHGEWPADDIDHINGDRADNRIMNLRVVNHQTNMQNKAVYANSKTGVHGVAWSKSKKRFQAYITINKVRKHIGNFISVDEAIAARKAAEATSACFHVNHGR